MNEKMSSKLTSFLFVFGVLALSACGGGAVGSQNSQSPSSPATPNTGAAANAKTISTVTPVVSGSGLSIASVCSAPQEIGADAKLSVLGGGKWARWDTEDGELSHGCDGGVDSVKLEVEKAKISAYYNVIGGPENVNNVSAKYMALQYGGRMPGEDALRRQYLEFCDKLSRKFFEADLPAKFKAKIESALDTISEKPTEIQDKAGNGFLTLSTVNTKAGLLTLEVRFFPSEAAYNKYKNS